jgi:hypothetical protein
MMAWFLSLTVYVKSYTQEEKNRSHKKATRSNSIEVNWITVEELKEIGIKYIYIRLTTLKIK